MHRPQAPEFVNSPSPATAVTTLALLTLLTACAETPASTFDDLASAHLPQIEGSIQVAGLTGEVEVLRDPWGVPHIYASNLDDLFLAQGFVQAQDRLWQMEMYRRAGEGRLSEVLGPEALQHDRVARLLKFRGPFDDDEYTSYHPEGRRILEAFAAGVNAYIDHATAAGELPVEFMLTGLEPEPWTAETPLLRMQTAMPVGDVRRELRLAEQVAELGAAEANRQANPTPWRELEVPAGVDLSLISAEVLGGVTGFRNAMSSPPLVAPYDGWTGSEMAMNLGARETSPGSNNWAIHGSRTASGHAIVANDPHRGVTNPSLRYVVHLDAPGWTAIGSTEPVLPGVAIGHNGRIAWGLTIVGTDQSDVYVEQVNPDNPKQVRWGDGWEEVRTITETVQVKDGAPVTMELEFSRHGPIFHRDPDNNLAYAMRSTMHEPGTTGYLSGLRLNVVPDCAAFVEELRYWLAPTENMICGDADGNIAWQAAALSPSRPNWHGRLPVPGTGEYEWDGFRHDLPTEFNPERGWVGTANHDIHPPGYDPPLFFKTASPFARFARVEEVLNAGSDYTLEDSRLLQQDAYSASGARHAALFRGWTATDAELETYRAELAAWDGVFDRESRAAAIYRRLDTEALDSYRNSPGESGPAEYESILAAAIARITADQGDDPAQWRWGRDHRNEFPHALVTAYDLPAAERSGGAGTVAATGATYRHIVDFADLDGSLFTNAPGQSGRPGSPYYGNLTEDWADRDYFPMLFSREAVAARAEYRLVLAPGG